MLYYVCGVKIMCETKQAVYKTLMCYFMVCRINEVAKQPTDIVIGYGYKMFIPRD